MIYNISTINYKFLLYEYVNPVIAYSFLLIFIHEISCVTGLMFVPKCNIGTSEIISSLFTMC
jgi:hypothetical protein